MYHEVKLDSLSKKQVSKLLNGHPVRVKMGGAIPAFVSAEHAKKLIKASIKGSGVNITLDPYAIAKNQHLRKAVGMLMGRGTGHDVAKALGKAAIAGTDAASARLVRSIEGSGGHKKRGRPRKMREHEMREHEHREHEHREHEHREHEHREHEHAKRGRPRKMAGGDGRGYGQAREQDAIRRSYPPTPGMSGRGKKSSTDQFRDWTKNIGQVFKPLNRGALGAAKRQVIGASGNAISSQISTQGNPYGMSSSNVPVQQTRYQMRQSKIDSRPVGEMPLHYSPYMGKPIYATPVDSATLGLPSLSDSYYDDSYSIPTGELYGVGAKRGHVQKHKRIMSEAQKAALAKGRHALRLKLNEMGAGTLRPAGGALHAAGY